jgi:hypothetical protein
VLFGGNGPDFLYGGGAEGGVDYLFGGNGPDVFGIEALAGSTVIEDFAFEDLIHLHNIPNLTSFADVLDNTTDLGSYSAITVDATQNIWIIGQTSATFQESHFSFA